MYSWALLGKTGGGGGERCVCEGREGGSIVCVKGGKKGVLGE